VRYKFSSSSSSYYYYISSFSALTLLVGSFDPYKPVPDDMTHNVFGGILNLAYLLSTVVVVLLL